MARIGDRRATYTFWWGDLRERPLGRCRRRCEDNIKMNLRETVGGYGLDSSGS